MNSLGFALNPVQGVVYDEVIAMLPAQALVFHVPAEPGRRARRVMPYDEAASHHGVRIIRLSDIEKVELIRRSPATGWCDRAAPAQRGSSRSRRRRDPRTLVAAVGDRFHDTTV